MCHRRRASCRRSRRELASASRHRHAQTRATCAAAEKPARAPLPGKWPREARGAPRKAWPPDSAALRARALRQRSRELGVAHARGRGQSRASGSRHASEHRVMGSLARRPLLQELCREAAALTSPCTPRHVRPTCSQRLPPALGAATRPPRAVCRTLPPFAVVRTHLKRGLVAQRPRASPRPRTRLRALLRGGVGAPALPQFGSASTNDDVAADERRRLQSAGLRLCEDAAGAAARR